MPLRQPGAGSECQDVRSTVEEKWWLGAAAGVWCANVMGYASFSQRLTYAGDTLGCKCGNKSRPARNLCH